MHHLRIVTLVHGKQPRRVHSSQHEVTDHLQGHRCLRQSTHEMMRLVLWQLIEVNSLLVLQQVHVPGARCVLELALGETRPCVADKCIVLWCDGTFDIVARLHHIVSSFACIESRQTRI